MYEHLSNWTIQTNFCAVVPGNTTACWEAISFWSVDNFPEIITRLIVPVRKGTVSTIGGGHCDRPFSFWFNSPVDKYLNPAINLHGTEWEGTVLVERGGLMGRMGRSFSFKPSFYHLPLFSECFWCFQILPTPYHSFTEIVIKYPLSKRFWGYRAKYT